MRRYEKVVCPRCKQTYQVPSDVGTLEITCRKCGTHFFWNSREGIIPKREHLSNYAKKSKKSRKILVFTSIIAFAIIAVFLFYFVKSSQTRWVTIDYSHLVDGSAITHSGQPLASILQDPSSKGEAQPFIDRFSYLLNHSVTLLFGPDSTPYIDVVNYFPMGSIQPVWIAILRGGRILFTTDGNRHARIFLIGKNPENAFHNQYSIIRHCLNKILPTDGSEISVQVFSYKNLYQKMQLQLNTKPYTFTSSHFPSSAGKISLDIVSLKQLFDKGGQLEGARLDHNKGLYLFAKKADKQTIAGQNLSLADFAVAYRAVFHAGDNAAYISLDKHKDPTKVTVNFGGFLEDTRIGAVILEADKRFKTICCGLDPNTNKDIRAFTRKFVPSFLTSAEREMMQFEISGQEKWIGTRFWFYPESIEVKTDPNYEYALMTKPYFRADAERSKDDFASLEQFEKYKVTMLSPSIGECIDHLNIHYTKYARAYPEIRELVTVARLMGICTWLKRANPDWIDLDELLAVQLPAFKTETEKAKLIAVSYLTCLHTKGLTTKRVTQNTKVLFLTPILGKSVKTYFKNATNLAKYICCRNPTSVGNYKNHLTEAKQLMNKHGDGKIQQMIDSENDLEALALYASRKLTLPIEVQLNKLDKQITFLEKKLKAETNPWTYDSDYRKYQQLIESYNYIQSQLQKSEGIPQIIEIGGGINLNPQYFCITPTLRGTELKYFKNITAITKSDWTLVNGKGKWIRNEIKENKVLKEILDNLDEAINDSLFVEWIKEEFRIDKFLDAKTYSWYDEIACKNIFQIKRMFDASDNTIQIIDQQNGEVVRNIKGTLVSRDKIVFMKSESQIPSKSKTQLD